MKRFALVRMLRGQPRFFAGTYVGNKTIPVPVTTAEPDKAKVYESKNVAQVAVDFFNAFDGLKARKPQRNWIVMELPEAWTP